MNNVLLRIIFVCLFDGLIQNMPFSMVLCDKIIFEKSDYILLQSDMIPSPPSNKLKSPATAFRTTIFKRDYARRQLQRNPNKDNDSGPLPALNK